MPPCDSIHGPRSIYYISHIPWILGHFLLVVRAFLVALQPIMVMWNICFSHWISISHRFSIGCSTGFPISSQISPVFPSSSVCHYHPKNSQVPPLLVPRWHCSSPGAIWRRPVGQMDVSEHGMKRVKHGTWFFNKGPICHVWVMRWMNFPCNYITGSMLWFSD